MTEAGITAVKPPLPKRGRERKHEQQSQEIKNHYQPLTHGKY